MKYTLITSLFLLNYMLGLGQNKLVLENSLFNDNEFHNILNTSIIISSDFDLNSLIELHKKKNDQTDEEPGYRIQITSNNDRSKIYDIRSEVYSKFSNIKNYLKYDQPYYRLRIGDFKTRLEARSYLERVIQHFPSAFIVADNIKIK